MMRLFVQHGCYWCTIVSQMLKENKIPYKEVNVFENDNLHELLRLGGKPQTPFLVDGEVKLYESEEIIKYAAATYTHARKKRRTRVGKKR